MELCLKDLREEAIAEFTRKLRSDAVSCDRFCHSFGLENRHPRKRFGEIADIGKLFPDTPIKLLIDVCRALQLYDLVELLEKAAKPRTLRPALLLKEIAKLPSDSNRPTTFFSKVKIVFVGDGEEAFDTIRNFFKKICPGSKISRSKPDVDLSQFQRSLALDVEREKIPWEIRQIELKTKDRGTRSLDRLLARITELVKRKNEIEKELLQMSGDLEAAKKNIEIDIFSAFEKSWGEERGKIFANYFCVYFDV